MSRVHRSRFVPRTRTRTVPTWLQDLLGLGAIIAIVWLLAALQAAAVWQEGQ